MIYLLTFGWCVASTLIPPCNAELWVIGNSVAGSGHPLLLALACTLAQCTAYTIYIFGGQAVLDRLPRVKARLEAFDVERYKKTAYTTLVLAATVGLPPLVMLSFVSRALGFTYRRFISVALAGRMLRFSLLAMLPETFRGLFS